jgi:hypothetical protein
LGSIWAPAFAGEIGFLELARDRRGVAFAGPDPQGLFQV